MNSEILMQVVYVKHLDGVVDSALPFRPLIENIENKVNEKISFKNISLVNL